MHPHDTSYRSTFRRLRVAAEDSVRLTLEEIETMLAERIDQWNREMVEKGIQIGREEVRQEGIQKGIQEGKAETLLQQLGLKFGSVSPEVQERVAAADADRLLEWSGRILTAERLEDVFGE